MKIVAKMRKTYLFLQLYELFVLVPGHVPGSSWWGVNLCLCAINMAEAAGDALPLTQLAEIYATCAIRIQTTLPGKFRYFSVRFYYEEILEKI